MRSTKSFRQLLSKMFHGVFCFFWMAMIPGIVITCLFYDWKGLMLFFVLLALAVLCFYRPFVKCCCIVYKKLTMWMEKHSMLSIFLLLIGMQMVVQIIFGYELAVEPSGDRKIIFRQACEIAMSGKWSTSEQYNFYFLRYPNNVFLLLAEAAWFTLFRWLGITNFMLANTVLNLLCIDSAIALCVCLAYHKFGKKTAVCFQLFCLFFLPFYTYIPFVYTDTLSLPVISGILLLFEFVNQYWEQGKKRNLYLVLAAIGILAFAGFLLKPTVVILPMACMLYMLIVKGKKTALLRTGFLLLIFVFCFCFYHQAMNHGNIVDQTDYDKENFPYTHWLMMGLQGYGNYSLADRQYTSSFETKEEKQKANMALIRTRLQEYGAAGLAAHQYIKGVSTWYNGKYDMDFYLQRNPVHHSWMQSMFFKDGKYYFLYSAYCTLYQFFLLVMVGLSLLQGYKSCQLDSAVVWKIAIFGLYLFLSFWETKPRYVMHFTPMLLLVAVDTVVKNKERAAGYFLTLLRSWAPLHLRKWVL